MLLGQYQLFLDGDYQMVLPEPFRELFDQGAYVTRGFEQNLLIMGEKEFQEIYGRVAGLNIADPVARLLHRLILGNASKLDITASGRIRFPQDLSLFAGLEKDIILVGQGGYCEVWSPSSWDKQTAILLDTAANSARFAQLDLALR